ncbi:uncharacterized protein LOC119274251 isoform X2 [Triticum dicoccoides]|uniref:uncharacterized protein LOC119274251 isoform X2 n=1 Tax=Triticum dicoccoides TaxID=85692 RepID=UPI0018908C6D|nr:uncharacterized protein LOC119274251 isoform X2 [Triticum dicoccoides]
MCIWGEREDGQKIAVKILHGMSGHDDVQFDKEFDNLVNLQHQNIVRLVGYCHETRREYLPCNETKVLADVTKRALCFEFMENGSLSDCLFDESKGHGWRTRYAIIKGICNGLKYLHEELKPPIFHLDLKPANILLDKNMTPKIADFGLSRFFKEEKSLSTNSPIGTLGYLPPEFIHHGIISNKLDIFSLGVVVIKIIAGPTGHRRSAEMTYKQFIKIVHGNWMNRLQSAASQDLLESYSEQVKRCVQIALCCVEADRQRRPTIGDIVNMLTETETLENYQGTLIDQMSTCMVKDTKLIEVHPLQLHFSFRPNKFISCPFHVTNNMNDQCVSVRCVPKHKEATPYYYARVSRIVGVVPPRSTHTFVVKMKQVEQPPANMAVLDMVVETIVGEVLPWDDSLERYFKDARKENSYGFREVTLKAVCATMSKTATSEIMLHDDDYNELLSMDAHPTEPWILAGYIRRLVIWNYKTQTRMMDCELYAGLAHSIRNFFSISDGAFVRTVRFIVQSTEQLFLVGDWDGYIHVHDCMTMKRVKEFKAHDDWVTSFAVHPSQPFVLSASNDKLIKLWNWEKGWECIRTFTGHSSSVKQVKFNPHDANTFVSASNDRTVKIWRVVSPIHVTSLKCEEVQAHVDYYPTGGDQQHYMVTGSAAQHGYRIGTARIWDSRTETCIREIKRLQSPCIVGVIDCHPERPVLVTASEFYGVSLHDSTTYRCVGTVHFGLGQVVCFAYVKGIRSIAIGHEHGVAILEIDRYFPKVLPQVRQPGNEGR